MIKTKQKILFFTELYPNYLLPNFGIFNYSKVVAIKKLKYDVKIIAPIGLTPPRFELKKILVNLYFNFTRIPFHEFYKGTEVYHPKWLRLNRTLFWKFEPFFLKLFSGRIIKKIILDYDPDLIIGSWLNPYGPYAKYIKKYYNKPVICYAEGSDILVFPGKYKKQWKFIENEINEYLDKVILISNYMNDYVKANRKLTKTALVEDGYDSVIFYYAKKSAIIKGRILTIGSLVQEKGHDILIKAFSLLKGNEELIFIGRVN